MQSFGWNPPRKAQISCEPDTRILNINGVRGFLLMREADFMFRLGAELDPAGRYLEIGSFLGLNVCCVASGMLASGNQTAEIHCVDTWETPLEYNNLPQADNLYENFCKNIKKTGVAEYIDIHKGYGPDMAASIEGSFDTIFIDGQRFCEECAANLQAWYPKLKPGGRFMGHDCVGEVRRALRNFCRQINAEFTFVEPPQSSYRWEIHK
jgi:hypothetical protein